MKIQIHQLLENRAIICHPTAGEMASSFHLKNIDILHAGLAELLPAMNGINHAWFESVAEHCTAKHYCYPNDFWIVVVWLVKPKTKHFNVTIFNVPFESSSSDEPRNHLTEREAPIVSIKPRTDTRYKTNVQNSQQIILGSKTVWKNEICTWKETFNHVNTVVFLICSQ